MVSQPTEARLGYSAPRLVQQRDPLLSLAGALWCAQPCRLNTSCTVIAKVFQLSGSRVIWRSMRFSTADVIISPSWGLPTSEGVQPGGLVAPVDLSAVPMIQFVSQQHGQHLGQRHLRDQRLLQPSLQSVSCAGQAAPGPAIR